MGLCLHRAANAAVCRHCPGAGRLAIERLAALCRATGRFRRPTELSLWGHHLLGICLPCSRLAEVGQSRVCRLLRSLSMLCRNPRLGKWMTARLRMACCSSRKLRPATLSAIRVSPSPPLHRGNWRPVSSPCKHWCLYLGKSWQMIVKK